MSKLISALTSRVAIKCYVGIVILALGAFGLNKQGCSFAQKFGFGDVEACVEVVPTVDVGK
jgi:hypothetical protein